MIFRSEITKSISKQNGLTIINLLSSIFIGLIKKRGRKENIEKISRGEKLSHVCEKERKIV